MDHSLMRRRFLQSAGAGAVAASLRAVAPDYAWGSPQVKAYRGPDANVADLVIHELGIDVAGKSITATLIKGIGCGRVLLRPHPWFPRRFHALE